MKLKDLKENKIAVQCKTEEQAIGLLQIFKDNNIKWLHDENIEIECNYWSSHGKETCYDIDGGFLEYGEISDYVEDYEIIQFEDLNLEELKSEKSKIRLKFTGVEEGKEFTFKNGDGTIYKIRDGRLIYKYKNAWINSILNDEVELVPEKIILTDTERKILEGRFKEGYNWVAKDEDGVCYFYTSKPEKKNSKWIKDLEYVNGYMTETPISLNFLNWEDSQPINLKELLTLRDERT